DDTDEIEPIGGRHAAEAEGDDPPASRLGAMLLLVGAVTAALLALPHPTPAAAAPCPKPPGGTAPPPPAPSASPSTSPSPSPIPSDTGGNPVSDFFNGLGRLLGITHDNAATASPSPSPPTPNPTQSGPV